MVLVQKVAIESRQRMWGVSLLINLAFTICMAMSGNIVKTIGITTIEVLQSIGILVTQMIMRTIVLCAEALGATVLGIAALLTAATVRPMNSATLRVFELPVLNRQTPVSQQNDKETNQILSAGTF